MSSEILSSVFEIWSHENVQFCCIEWPAKCLRPSESIHFLRLFGPVCQYICMYTRSTKQISWVRHRGFCRYEYLNTEDEYLFAIDLAGHSLSVLSMSAKKEMLSLDEIFATSCNGSYCGRSSQLNFLHNESIMMTSSNGNIFRVTGPLRGEFTGHRWIPRKKASDAELWCFLWSASEYTVK